jgi:hypothetical protein
MTNREIYTADLQKAHDSSDCVIIPAERRINLRDAGETFHAWKADEISAKRKKLHRNAKKKERKPNHLLRQAVALGVIGVTAFFGIHKINDITYKPNETPKEAAISKAIESHKEGSFNLLKGDVKVKAGAIIRENPFVIEDKAGETNKVEVEKIIENYNLEKEIIIHNPIVMEDLNNPANGVWYGFTDNAGEDSGIFWTNGQNITKRTKNAQIESFDGKEKVGVVSQ